MSFLDIFKSEPKVIDLDAMTDEQRVKFFAEQAKKDEKMMRQVRSFVNQVVGLAGLLLPDEAAKMIEKIKPYIEAFLTNPELIADNMSESLDSICEKAGIPAHHLILSVSKPKGVVVNNEKVRNKDVRFELRIFNPHFQQWQSIEFDLRTQLKSIKNKAVKYNISEVINQIYNAKPENETLKLEQ